MNPVFAPVLGALIGALAGIVGGLLIGQRQSRLEREKWLRGIHDAFANELRSSVKELTTELASAAHSMCWLARYGPDRLSQERLDDYDEGMYKLLPRIAGLHAMIAGMDLDVHRRLRELVDRVYKLDASIGQAGRGLVIGRPESASELATYHEISGDLERELSLVAADAICHYALSAASTSSDREPPNYGVRADRLRSRSTPPT